MCPSRNFENSQYLSNSTELQTNIRTPPPPQKKRPVYAVWGSPQVILTKFKLVNFFIHTASNWNHLSDNQVKNPTL